jgi:hypothetical protein
MSEPTTPAQKAAESALAKYRRQSVIGFAVLFVGLIVAVYTGDKANDEGRKAVVDSGQATAISSCNRDFTQTEEFRNIVARSKCQMQGAVNRGDASEEGADEQLQALDDARKDLTLPDCRKAGENLTSDPDDVIRIPEPLYPKDS